MNLYARFIQPGGDLIACLWHPQLLYTGGGGYNVRQGYNSWLQRPGKDDEALLYHRDRGFLQSLRFLGLDVVL